MLNKSPFAIPFRRTFAPIVFLLSFIISTGSLTVVFGQNRQLSLADILIALRSKKAVIEEKNRILATAVKERGITFAMTPEIEKELGSTGAYPELLNAIKQKATAITEKAAPTKVDIAAVAAVVAKSTPPPPDFDFYRNRATSYFEKGDFSLAVSDLGKALEMRPNDANTYLERGLTLARQGKYDASLADLDKAVELDSKSSNAYYGRAVSHEKLGNLDKAFADYQKAAALDAKNDAAKTAVGRITAEKAKAEIKPVVDVPKVVVAEKSDVNKFVAVGALNPYASRLVTPTYSQIDRRMGYQGKVTVQISLDEEGKVVSLTTADGPRTLRAAAEDAVRRSKFNPVTVDGKGVKAAGFITFNFVANQ